MTEVTSLSYKNPYTMDEMVTIDAWLKTKGYASIGPYGEGFSTSLLPYRANLAKHFVEKYTQTGRLGLAFLAGVTMATTTRDAQVSPAHIRGKVSPRLIAARAAAADTFGLTPTEPVPAGTGGWWYVGEMPPPEANRPSLGNRAVTIMRLCNRFLDTQTPGTAFLIGASLVLFENRLLSRFHENLGNEDFTRTHDEELTAVTDDVEAILKVRPDTVYVNTMTWVEKGWWVDVIDFPWARFLRVFRYTPRPGSKKAYHAIRNINWDDCPVRLRQCG